MPASNGEEVEANNSGITWVTVMANKYAPAKVRTNLKEYFSDCLNLSDNKPPNIAEINRTVILNHMIQLDLFYKFNQRFNAISNKKIGIAIFIAKNE